MAVPGLLAVISKSRVEIEEALAGLRRAGDAPPDYLDELRGRATKGLLECGPLEELLKLRAHHLDRLKNEPGKQTEIRARNALSTAWMQAYLATTWGIYDRVCCMAIAIVSDKADDRIGWILEGNAAIQLPRGALRLIKRGYQWPLALGYEARNCFLHGREPLDVDYDAAVVCAVGPTYRDRLVKRAFEKGNGDCAWWSGDLIQLCEWCEPKTDAAHAVLLRGATRAFQSEVAVAMGAW